MRLFKVFGTARMPEALFKWLRDDDQIRSDDFVSYSIGEYLAEAAADPATYAEEDLRAAAAVDAWLISNGAADGEMVLIAHGEDY